MAETFNPQYIKDIYDEIIEPRIYDGSGKKFSLKDALRNIRKVNIVSHCYGGYVAMRLEDLMSKRMDELGYLKLEQEKIKN